MWFGVHLGHGGQLGGFRGVLAADRRRLGVFVAG